MTTLYDLSIPGDHVFKLPWLFQINARISLVSSIKHIEILMGITVTLGFQGGAVVKNPPINAGDTGSIPGSRRSPGEGNDNPLPYSCLENPMDRGA